VLAVLQQHPGAAELRPVVAQARLVDHEPVDRQQGTHGERAVRRQRRDRCGGALGVADHRDRGRIEVGVLGERGQHLADRGDGVADRARHVDLEPGALAVFEDDRAVGAHVVPSTLWIQLTGQLVRPFR
jgi:hypothetical protein